MANNELQEQELQSIIEQSVDDAVKRAFKKYGRVSWRSLLSPRRLLSFLVILAVLGSGIWLYERNRANEPVAPVEDHDLTTAFSASKRRILKNPSWGRPPASGS